MKTVCLVLLLSLPGLAPSPARGEEKVDSTLPRRVARFMQGVTLAEDQQAHFQALKREFEPRLAEARKRVAAHDLAKWRLDAIEREWCERIDAILTARQKQVRLIAPLQEPTCLEFVETPIGPRCGAAR